MQSFLLGFPQAAQDFSKKLLAISQRLPQKSQKFLFVTKVVQKQHILLLSASFIYLVWCKNTIKVSFLNIFAQF